MKIRRNPQPGGTEDFKYEKLASEFRDQMKSGVLKVGDRLPSLASMQAQHGIGQGTMERVYALLEEEGLIVREPRRGTFVSKPRKRQATGLIGFVRPAHIEMSQTPYFALLKQGAEEVIQQEDKRFLLLEGDSTADWERVDGILIFSPSARLGFPDWLPEGMPSVSLVAPIEDMPSVVADDSGGARQAVEHLLSLGHRRIACMIRQQEDAYLSHLREDGYRNALKDAGIYPRAEWMARNFYEPPFATENSLLNFWEHGYQGMLQWLATDWKKTGCTAILAQNDLTAIGIMQALQQAGIQVPDEVSVVGFDGTSVGECCRPLLTSVEVPLRQIGRRGGELLLRQIAGEKLDATEIALPTRLLERASTAAASG